MSLGELFYGWRVVCVCFVAATFTWGLGVFGSSVYLGELTTTRAWPVSTVSVAVTVFFLTAAVVLPLVGRAIDRLGPRPVISAGVLLLAVGVIAVGQLNAIWQVFGAFVCMGLGYATMSVTGLSATLVPWFERHQGRSITLAMTGASVGAMSVVPLLVTAIVIWGFATATGFAGVAMIIVLVPLILIVLRFRSPEEVGLSRDGDPELVFSKTSVGDSAASISATQENGRLWSVVVAFSFGLIVQIGFLAHHYALALPSVGSAGAGWVVGGTGAAGLLGRLLLARVIDRVDPRHYSAGIFGVQVFALGAIAMFPVVPVLVSGSLVYGFCLGQITTLPPIVVRREFGADAFGAIFGTAGAVIQFCSAFGPALYGVLVSHFGSYGSVLMIAAGFELVAAFIILAVPAPKSRPATPGDNEDN